GDLLTPVPELDVVAGRAPAVPLGEVELERGELPQPDRFVNVLAGHHPGLGRIVPQPDLTVPLELETGVRCTLPELLGEDVELDHVDREGETREDTPPHEITDQELLTLLAEQALEGIVQVPLCPLLGAEFLDLI